MHSGETERLTHEQEQHIAQDLMHRIGAHATILITIYPDDRGTRCSFVVCSLVPKRAFGAMARALIAALDHARSLVYDWLGEPNPDAKTKAN
jgi:hypothetical protein